MNTILSSGKCTGHYEPMAEHGLEGYVRGGNYKFQRVENKNGKGFYMRVFPNQDTDYYETCGPVEFKYYFTITGEQSPPV